MDKIINILKNWVDINLSTLKTGKSPHVSYILSTILMSPVSRSLLNDLSPYDVLRVSYVIFYMFEGLPIEEAKKKSQKIHMVVTVSMDDIIDEKEECSDCYGDGTLECNTCDGDAVIDCGECSGEGTVEYDEGEEECDWCDGSGKVECDECYGDMYLDCSECSGDGEVGTGYEYIEYDETLWTFTDDKLYKTFLDALNGKIQNSDFYDLGNESSGDLTLLRSEKKGMRLEEFEFPEITSGETKIATIFEDIPEIIKRSVTIQKYGNRNSDYRIN